MATPGRRPPSSRPLTSKRKRQSRRSGRVTMHSGNGASGEPAYAERVEWQPVRPRFRVTRFVVAWAVTAVSLLIAAAIVPGVSIPSFGAALLVAALVGVMNALIPPLIAALRPPLTIVVDFLLLLIVDAWILLAASKLSDDAIDVSSFWRALVTALLASAVGIVLDVLFGVDDDET